MITGDEMGEMLKSYWLTGSRVEIYHNDIVLPVEAGVLGLMEERGQSASSIRPPIAPLMVRNGGIL